jgi:hypothetical protein
VSHTLHFTTDPKRAVWLRVVWQVYYDALTRLSDNVTQQDLLGMAPTFDTICIMVLRDDVDNLEWN